MYVRKEISALSGYLPGEQPQAGKFIKLNTNESPYPCSPAVRRAIGRVCQGGLERYPDPHASAFRTRAGEVLGVDPDWILCGNGSDDLLTILTRTFVGQDDFIRLPAPSYVLYRTLAGIQAARVEEIPFRADWTLGDEFAAARENMRLAFLPNPNSPSGTVLSPAQVLELAKKLPCPLVVDEAYVDFAEENCLSLVARNEKIIVTRTLSKSYALAGLRFGFLVAQPHLVEQMMKVKDSYNCDALSIAGATAAIDDQAWLADHRAKILATRTQLIDGLRQLGFDVVDSQANFVWCSHAGRPAKPLYEQLKQANILVRFMNYADWGDGLRISVGSDEQINALLEFLKTG